MSYVVRIGLMEVELETLDEVIELGKRIGGGAHATVTPANGARKTAGKRAAKSPANGAARRTAWGEFAIRLSANQRRLLEEIKKRKAITADALAEAINVEGRSAVGGILTGVTKNAKHVGLVATQIVRKEKD